MLANMSTDYYSKMERGDLAGVSEDVLDALARALQLDEAETEHLHDLARAATPRPARRRAGAGLTDATVRPSLQRFLDTITGSPTLIQNQRTDFIEGNSLARALYAPLLDDPTNRRNNAKFTFLNPASRTFFVDWDYAADSIVGSLRSATGRDPHDRALTDLIGELVTRSDAFRLRWAAHDVRRHRTGTKRIRHPDVGDLEFSFEAMELPDNPGWTMYAYTTIPGSPTEERIKLLGSLAATQAEVTQAAYED